jgi:hypothetical protein
MLFVVDSMLLGHTKRVQTDERERNATGDGGCGNQLLRARATRCAELPQVVCGCVMLY